MVFIGDSQARRKDFTADENAPTGTNHNAHHVVFNGAQGQLYALLSSSTQYFRGRVNYVQLGPDSLPPNVFGNAGSFFDFRFTGSGGVHTLRWVTIRLQIQNQGSATSQIFLQAPSHFVNRIEVLPDGGATQDILYADQLAVEKYMNGDLTHNANCGFAEGYSTESPGNLVVGTYQNRANLDEDGNALLAGQTREYFFPIHCMLTTAELFLPLKDQDPRLRIYTALNPWCTDSVEDPAAVPTTQPASGSLGLAGADIILGGYIYNPDILKKLAMKYKRQANVSRVLVRERQITDVSTATPFAVMADQTMTVFNGDFACISVYVVRNGSVQEQLYSSNRTQPNDTTAGVSETPWIPLARVSIIDSSGNPVWYQDVPGEFLKAIHASHVNTKTIAGSVKNLYPWIFAKDFCQTLRNGSNQGGIALDSNFQLQLTPGSFLPNAPGVGYSIHINALRYALLTMDRTGKFTVIKL